MSENLVVSVYLNQRLVFDLVAMLQGGIATVTRLEKAVSEERRGEETAKARFSLADAFSSLLKIQLSGEKSRSQTASDTSNSIEERTHTPTSLFAALRAELFQRELVVDASKKFPAPGEFVEFEASMRRNPLIEALESVQELLGLAGVFIDESPQKGKQLQRSGHGDKPRDFTKTASQIKVIADSLKLGSTQDLVARHVSQSSNAVLTLESQFLNDPSMSDLIDGTFKVLGKVTRSVESNEGSVSLLRRASVNTAPELLEKLIGAFKGLDQGGKLRMPELEMEVRGPVFQVIPIAIFA